MKKTIVAGLAAVVTACGSGESARPLQYGAPQAPTVAEQSAGSSAQTTLQGSLTFAAPTQPSTGAMALADQLAMSLGAYSPSGSAPTAQVQKSAGRAVSQAFATGGLDPACVHPSPTLDSVTWSGCVIRVTDTDPYTGDTTDITVTIDGSVAWSAGVTTWNIDETYDAAMTSGGDTITMDGTATLDGTITVTDSTIVGNASSAVNLTVHYLGFSLTEGVLTTLGLDLGYQASPFCIDSGTLTLEHVWTQRPMGTTADTLPNQGWRFEWTGCNAFEVSHGS